VQKQLIVIKLFGPYRIETAWFKTAALENSFAKSDVKSQQAPSTITQSGAHILLSVTATAVSHLLIGLAHRVETPLSTSGDLFICSRGLRPRGQTHLHYWIFRAAILCWMWGQKCCSPYSVCKLSSCQSSVVTLCRHLGLPQWHWKDLKSSSASTVA
jgi:hypothetical protein